MNGPNKDLKFPLKNIDRLCFLKNIIKNPNIIVGDYTYYDDFENVEGVAEFAATLSNVERVEILPFHKMGEHKWEALNLEYRLKNTESPSKDLVERVQDQFRQRKLTVL